MRKVSVLGEGAGLAGVDHDAGLLHTYSSGDTL